MSEMGFDQLGLMIGRLDATHDACHIRIGELRRQMDIACGQGHITLREWRTLLDRIAVIETELENRVMNFSAPSA